MTKTSKILEGYRGSVSSKKWKKIWIKELRENFNLFECVVLREFESRDAALKYERVLHLRLDVAEHPLFINKSIAVIGSFGGSDRVVAFCKVANTGKRLARIISTNECIKIRVEDFNPEIHKGNVPSLEVKSIIAKNTSNSMTKLVKTGKHWFQSEEFIKESISRRQGVKRTDVTNSRISSSRVLLFKRQWELYPWNTYNWANILSVVWWYKICFVKHSKESSKSLRDISEQNIQSIECRKWVMRKLLRGGEDRLYLYELCDRYEEELDGNYQY